MSLAPELLESGVSSAAGAASPSSPEAGGSLSESLSERPNLFMLCG